MDMMDLYTLERAEDALEETKKFKNDLLKEIEDLDTIMFILKYYIVTGVALEPAAFGIEGDSDD